MGEQYTFGKGGQEANAAQPQSFAENLLSKEQIAHLAESGETALIKRAVEASENFHKILQEAYDLLHPIIKGINELPEDLRKELVASITDLKGPAHEAVSGPAYDEVRKLCA